MRSFLPSFSSYASYKKDIIWGFVKMVSVRGFFWGEGVEFVTRSPDGFTVAIPLRNQQMNAAWTKKNRVYCIGLHCCVQKSP